MQVMCQMVGGMMAPVIGMVRDQLKEAVMQLFKAADSNEDGKLSPEEWAAFLPLISSTEPFQPLGDSDDFKDFAKADVNGDGELDEEEFRTHFRTHFKPH